MKIITEPIWQDGEYTYAGAEGQVNGFRPKLTAYLHEDEKKRPCMLVVPGGAYCFVCDAEGEPVARRFFDKGYQTFVLEYTTNPSFSVPLLLQPIRDLSRAVRLIRSRADSYAIEEDQLAICGFSAGGHLCGSLCVHFDDIKDGNPLYQEISNRPDAAILSYPVITSGEFAHRDSFIALLGKDAESSKLTYMSLEKQVTGQTPPSFLWTTATDDLVPAENTLLFASACQEQGVPYELHVFSNGPHGLSLADEEWARKHQAQPNPQVAVWPQLAEEFLNHVWRSNRR